MTRVLLWAANGFVIAALAVLALVHAELLERLARGWLVVPGPTSGAAPREPPPSSRRIDPARVILDRNPFDSSWTRRARADSTDTELCSSVAVHIVSQSPDASWSLASLAEAGGAARLVRAGDALGPYAVVFVGDDPESGRPAVWLRRRGVLCRAPLGAPTSAPPPPRPSFPWELPSSVRDGIRSLDEGRIEIDRATYSELLPNIARHLGPLGVRRSRAGGAELRGVRPGSLLDLLGLATGDVIESVNGHDVTTPSGMMEAYPELFAARHFVVRLRRKGLPSALEIRVR